jgi:hypothetical protein
MKRRCDPNGIRTRVTAVKGRCPGPLDDRVKSAGNIEFLLSDARQIARQISFLTSLLLLLRPKIGNYSGCPRGCTFMLSQYLARVFNKRLPSLIIAQEFLDR